MSFPDFSRLAGLSRGRRKLVRPVLAAVAIGGLIAAGVGAEAGVRLWPSLLRNGAFLLGSGRLAGQGFARWIENVEAGSGAEKALFRLMQVPGGEFLFRRPPGESVAALGDSGDKTAALYSLRALEEERGLNFEAAERDWKNWAAQAEDKSAAELDLADFYERRLKPNEELAALEAVGNSQASAGERWTAAENQRAWQAWARTVAVVDDYALGRPVKEREYAAWVRRYPNDPNVYQQELGFLLEGKEFDRAADVIGQYGRAFPADEVFPLEAQAQLATAKGGAADGLAVYERAFQPLWPAALVKDYMDLVVASRGQRAMADRLRARMAADPNDWRDAVRLFYLEQQQGQLEPAKAVLAAYRERKEGAAWAPDELFTLAWLYEQVADYPEAARYYYALAATHGDNEQRGLAGLARVLLTAPEQPLRVGGANLAMYKNIATMDRGPGYWNGILSLWMNTQGPENEFASESQTAVPYFHRAKAAELVAELDKRFPQAAERPQLHVLLMQAYGAYGENDAVLREGTGFLAQFPKDPQRVTVALATADAYARGGQPEKEFALYADLLKELAAKADGVPLGDGFVGSRHTGEVRRNVQQAGNAVAAFTQAQRTEAAPQATGNVRSASYEQVLDRYLSRLVGLHRLPDALAVLRGELDRNAQDPGLYQRLADFLDQNALNSHEEEVYQKAIDQFQQPGWYAKLARFYLRSKRKADYSALTHKVTGIFAGTELEAYLKDAPAPDRSLAIEVNRYALARFPHNLTFVRHLLAQHVPGGISEAEMETLLWAHWNEAPDLRDRLLELLSRTGRLESTLATLRTEAPEIEMADWAGLTKRNPAAGELWVEASLWQSHYEDAVGEAGDLAKAYPANGTIADQAASLYRSLAYFHPEDTDKAAAIAKVMVEAEPGNLDRMARVGDIYADRERMADAEPWFARMAQAKPGEADGYLQSATVYWDYFEFPAALAELKRGRERLGQPTLYSYQAGAILESEGDRAAAVKEYLAGALAENGSGESRERLLLLAKRKELQGAIEAGTGNLLRQGAPTAAGISLRLAVLDAERRKADVEQELRLAVGQASGFDTLDALSQAAREHDLPQVEESALRRQVALTTDPEANLELRYKLVDLLQQRSPADAAAEEDAIYREHAKVLGVVRSTVDYDWEHERKPLAVTVLLQAADAAYPELKNRFQLEAARKLTELGEYARAGRLVDGLLAQKPIDAEYQAEKQDNLARSGDEPGLAAFDLAQMDRVKKAGLDKDDKTARIAELRRGMITAATLMDKPAVATDQYIELVNAYSDDANLAQEAALYALAHGTRDRLFSYYQKTIAASPRDPRWSIVLARLATAAEEYPLAIDAYAKAIVLRPERRELLEGQAELDQRLHRLDDAVADYEKLYTLSYKDPSWMEKTAEARARQGRAADAVKALETGWIEGRPASAENEFNVAVRLERWGLLDEAQRFAEQGLTLAGDDLLVESIGQQGAATYARVMARKRLADTAFTRLAEARQKAANVTLAVVAQQVHQEGVGAVTDSEWRAQRVKERTQAATVGFAQALGAMGEVAGTYYTPEEKAQFAGWLKAKRGASDLAELLAVYLPAAKAAELADVVSDWQWERIEKDTNARQAELSDWVSAESERGLTEQAAARIEKLAGTVPANERQGLWTTATELYKKTGDQASELRTLTSVLNSAGNGGDRARWFQLLLALKPQVMAEQASGDDGAQYLLAHGSPEQALAGVATRAKRMPAVWNSAYTALEGLYLRQQTPAIGQAFATALAAEEAIGERIDHPADKNRQLTGEVWFYYGSRYAEYLDEAKDERGDDYREAELEHTPESADAYRQLADYEAEAGKAEAALADYQDTLELRRDQPAALDAMATIEWKLGRQSDALGHWSDAVKLLAAEIDARRVPETFWGDFSQVLGSVAAHGQYGTIRAGVDALLHVYIARNGEYRTETLLEAGYHANGDSIEWLLETSQAAHDAVALLETVPTTAYGNGTIWLRKEQISRLRARILELALARGDGGNGTVDNEGYSVDNARRMLVMALLDEKNYPAAREAMAKLTAKQLNDGQWLDLRLAVVEAAGGLQALLDGWKAPGSEAPTAETLRGARGRLSEKGSRAVMRYLYEQALANRELTEVNFLGLAGIRLVDGDTAGAVELLKRMTLVAGDPWTETDAAAALLEERGKPAEALLFLKPLQEASPWNAGYKVRLARALLGVDAKSAEGAAMLAAVVADPQAEYADRLEAAKGVKAANPAKLPDAGSDELRLLAGQGCPAPDAAAKPYFVAAPMAAAECASGKDAAKTAERLLHEALGFAQGNRTLRLSYVWAAFAAGNDSRGLIAAEPILAQWSGNYYGGATDADATGAENHSVTLTAAVQQRLFGLVEKAREKRHETSEALELIHSARGLATDAKQLQALDETEKRLQLELDRETENEGRAPKIHNELVQDRVVRPRLLPGMAFVARKKAEEETE